MFLLNPRTPIYEPDEPVLKESPIVTSPAKIASLFAIVKARDPPVANPIVSVPPLQKLHHRYQIWLSVLRELLQL